MSMQLEPGRIPVWTIADRFRKARESAGFSASEFAQRTSMARGTISAAENGHRVPSRANMRLWALATGVPFEWLETGKTPSGDDGAPVDVGPTGIEPMTSTVKAHRFATITALRAA